MQARTASVPRNRHSASVSDLILPVVLFGAENLSRHDSRLEVRVISRLQYIDIHSGWSAGYASPEWFKAIGTCVTELRSVFKRVEPQLVDHRRLVTRMDSLTKVMFDGLG